MKVTLRRSPGGSLSIYIPKKDLELVVQDNSVDSLWGGTLTLSNGWVLALPEMETTTALPITVEARKVSS
jgi:nitrogen fixation protein NifT